MIPTRVFLGMDANHDALLGLAASRFGRHDPRRLRRTGNARDLLANQAHHFEHGVRTRDNFSAATNHHALELIVRAPTLDHHAGVGIAFKVKDFLRLAIAGHDDIAMVERESHCDQMRIAVAIDTGEREVLVIFEPRIDLGRAHFDNISSFHRRSQPPPIAQDALTVRSMWSNIRLHRQQAKTGGASMAKLEAKEVKRQLKSLTGWEYKDNAIHKLFRFKEFMEGIQFINQVAGTAEAMDHHPDININYTRITFLCTSHDSGGVTERDLKLARAIEEAYVARSIN